MAQQSKIGNSDNSQTAVEWLEKQLFPRIDFESVEERKVMRDFFTQAKAIEKEQVESAFNYRKHMTLGTENQINTGEDYYNETYNK